MKKIISILISICMLYTSVYAISVSSYEYIKRGDTPLIELVDRESDLYKEYATKLEIAQIDSPRIFEVDGEIYCFFESANRGTDIPVKLSGEYIESPNVIWTGEYYYSRYVGIDGHWYNPKKYAYPLLLFDKDGNIVKEYNLKDNYGLHAEKIGYMNGTYYCQFHTSDKYTIKSTDFENWEETDEPVPQNFENIMMMNTKFFLDKEDGSDIDLNDKSKYNCLYTSEKCNTFCDKNMRIYYEYEDAICIDRTKVSLDRINFSDVIFESEKNYRMIYTLGEWVVYCDEDTNFYFTNDGIYFVKVDYPSDMLEFDKENDYSYYCHKIYEYGDEIICDMLRDDRISVCARDSSGYGYVRYRIPKNEVYQRLKELKSATHVQLNGEYLGFEVPPVTENYRTLVPMRFLFEQIGANVEWDEATQTATATLSEVSEGDVQAFSIAEEKTVTFGIDNTTAVVNGTNSEMDVPARLVDGKTMVPLRFLSENLGYNVEWDEATKTAIITKD